MAKTEKEYDAFSLDLEDFVQKKTKIGKTVAKSTSSFETWLENAHNYPHLLPKDCFQLFITQGDVDFLDIIRAVLLASQTETLYLVTAYIGKAHLTRLACLHGTGAYRRLHLTLSTCSFDTTSCSVKEAREMLAGVPHDLRIVSHQAKFAVSDNVLILTSANINRNPRAENVVVTSNPDLVAAFRELAKNGLVAEPKVYEK